MIIIPKDEFLENKKKSIALITYNSVFIYPTDTIYGIGCDATNPELVKKIHEIKQSAGQPFSVIVPSKEWIKQNLEYKDGFDEWLDKLPGPYTLIMKLKKKDCVSTETTANRDTLGVRIPDNWFSDVVKDANTPIITTSVNLHGEKPVTSMAEIPESIKSKVDFAIDDGVITGNPSTIIDLTQSPPKIIERK